MRTGVVLDLLVWRPSGHHQQHLVKPQRVARLLRKQQVPDVRRVEGPAQDPERTDPYSLTWPVPCTTYFVEVSSRSPIGPRACSFWVELPISAPIPNSYPSVKRVEAFT